MARDRTEEREALDAFAAWRRERPSAGTVVSGTSEQGYTAQIAHVDCDAVGLVALASELMLAASEKLRAIPCQDGIAPLIYSIEQARAALRFETPDAMQ